MTILYLVRHGETGGNFEGRFQGITDNPLNDCLLYTSDAADE